MTVQETAKKWDLSERRVIKLCQEGRIEGARKQGSRWDIPDEAVKPADQGFSGRDTAGFFVYQTPSVR